MSKQTWEADFTRISDAIGAIPNALVIADGGEYVNPSTVPAGLLSVYSGLVSIGYANGWL